MVFVILILWTTIYAVDSATQLSNIRGLNGTEILIGYVSVSIAIPLGNNHNKTNNVNGKIGGANNVESCICVGSGVRTGATTP